MNLLCYSLFYPVALAGGAARCASTFMSNFQLSIVNCFTVPPDDEKLTLPDAA